MKECRGYPILGLPRHSAHPSEFNKDIRGKDGLQPRCRHCQSKWNARDNPKRNPNHPTPIYAEINSFCAARARAKRILRYPTWISHPQEQQIKAIYNLRDKLNRCHGYAYWHVDHIIPLLGKEVSGLHVPENLQLVPSDVILSKSNQWNWERQE